MVDYFTCSGLEDFFTDMGTMFLIGPGLHHDWDWSRGENRSEQQDRTCVSGQLCTVDDLQGYFLSENDKYQVLDTCGTASAPVGWPNDGVDNEVTALMGYQDIDVHQNARIKFGTARVTSQGGTYQLCWCAAGYTCGSGSGVDVTVSTITLIGPLRNTYTCVSGRTCRVDLTGTLLSPSDTVVLMDTCATASFVQRVGNLTVASLAQSGYSVFWDRMTPFGGTYRLLVRELISLLLPFRFRD
jgi:hypothetical protein